MPARPTTDLVVERRAALPTIRYPAELPVSQRRDEIAEAVERHQVVIVAGETGSGKTTQLPKICLDLGRGIEATIGHTQPRRLAARTVAARIAEELGTEVGGVVGYAVRFTDRVGDLTLVKLMTDGILLNEIHRDRMLRAYDTVIVDEAHERSLNIDFILGYLVRLLPRRPDLKVIVTSATIDADRFSSHFGGAPVIEVTGRTHPVEVRYQPLDDGSTNGRDQIAASCGRSRPATSSCSSPVSARSVTPPGRSSISACPTPRSSRSTPGCPPPSSTGSSLRTAADASCSRPTSPRPR
jgi:ATP-dependent helicase HrpA